MKSTCILAFLAFLLSACSAIKPEPEISEPISTKPAVIDLLDAAQTHSAYGEHVQAKSVLERALRLDPQNAYLWFELAKVNRDQGKDGKAKNLALRAKSFTEDKRLLKVITRFINGL